MDNVRLTDIVRVAEALVVSGGRPKHHDVDLSGCERGADQGRTKLEGDGAEPA